MIFCDGVRLFPKTLSAIRLKKNYGVIWFTGILLLIQEKEVWPIIRTVDENKIKLKI